MDFSGKKVMVVGVAMSGIASARLLINKGAHVVLYDAKTIDEFDSGVFDEFESVLACRNLLLLVASNYAELCVKFPGLADYTLRFPRNYFDMLEDFVRILRFVHKGVVLLQDPRVTTRLPLVMSGFYHAVSQPQQRFPHHRPGHRPTLL